MGRLVESSEALVGLLGAVIDNLGSESRSRPIWGFGHNVEVPQDGRWRYRGSRAERGRGPTRGIPDPGRSGSGSGDRRGYWALRFDSWSDCMRSDHPCADTARMAQ
jgi:hypothetical protein